VFAEHQQNSIGSRALLQLFSKTRWFGAWTLCVSILKYKAALKSAVWDPKIPQDRETKVKCEELQELVCVDKCFWPNLQLVSDTLKPLALAIKNIEGSLINSRLSLHVVDEAFVQALRKVAEFDAEDRDDVKEVSYKCIRIN
jgi:hypothetical protein